MDHGRGTPYALVVEDHPLVAESLDACIRACAGDFSIDVADSLRKAGEILAYRPAPALIVTDLTLADAQGMDSPRYLRAVAPESPLLVFTALDDPHLRSEAIALGAIGYLVKSTSTDGLRDAIKTVIGRRRNEAAGNVANDDPHCGPLTKKQFAVLAELAAGRSNKEIATRLGISDQTVSSHMKEILGRLGVRNRTEAAVRYFEMTKRSRPAGAPARGAG